jgi:hypothetical protein
MGTWVVRVSAVIEDDMEIELDDGATEEEAITAAHAEWSFVEASQWTERILKRPDRDVEDDE